MTSGPTTLRTETRELAALVDELSKRATVTNPLELVLDWQGLERRIFACLRRIEREAPSSLPEPRDLERLRNLAWEVGVSIELHSVHSRALATLAAELAKRAARLAARRGLKPPSPRASFAARR